MSEEKEIKTPPVTGSGKLPKLELGAEKTSEEDRHTNKLFNMRIPPVTIERLKLLKDDVYLNGITWHEFLELAIQMTCQAGMVSRETIEKLKGMDDWDRSLPKETKDALGVGVHWVEVGPIIENLRDQMTGVRETLSLVEEALYEFATAVEASEEAEIEEGEDFDETPQEENEGDLFGSPEKDE